MDRTPPNHWHTIGCAQNSSFPQKEKSRLCPPPSPTRQPQGIRTAPFSSRYPAPQMLGHRKNVLVAAAAHVHHHQMVLRLLRRDLENLGERVCGLERRNDAFELAAE